MSPIPAIEMITGAEGSFGTQCFHQTTFPMIESRNPRIPIKSSWKRDRGRFQTRKLAVVQWLNTSSIDFDKYRI